LGRAHHRAVGRSALLALGLFAAAVHAAPPPDFSVPATQFPGDDGVILRWEQTWVLGEDGSLRRRDHKWYKFFSDRPIGRMADPRIDYDESREELILHVAQTHLPDGSVLPVPDYSRNVTGPGDVAGWPQYAGWRQMVISFSGIQPGCVTELDYEVVTRPGSTPWLSADLRMNEDDPVLERVLRVNVPRGAGLKYRVERIDLSECPAPARQSDGSRTYLWRFRNVTSDRDEPNSPPWFERGGRLWFTTCPDAGRWLDGYLSPVERAVATDDAVNAFAEGAVESEPDARERIRKLTTRLRDTFHVLGSSKARRTMTARPAPQVLRANYGNEFEAAALCSAALRAVGFETALVVGVEPRRWSDDIPSDDAFWSVVIDAGRDGQRWFVHPTQGVIEEPVSGAPRLLLARGDEQGPQRTLLKARGQDEGSLIEITGKLTVGEDDRVTGQLRVRATGAYFDPSSLKSADEQKRFAGRIASGLLGDLSVREVSVEELSSEGLRLTASVGLDAPITPTAGLRIMKLGDGPISLAYFSIPLSAAQRRTDVALTSAWHEKADIMIAFPEGRHPKLHPFGEFRAEGAWGHARQNLVPSDEGLRMTRDVRMMRDRLTTQELAGVREAFNRLRSTAQRVIAYTAP
jgi:hypothetical protein